MRYTLLQIVQQILAALDSDEVNSIDDTVESAQVALLVRGVYYDLIAECNLPSVGTFFQLNASGDNTKPTLMTIPEDILSVEWVKYDNIEAGETYSDYVEVKYLEPSEFMAHINGFVALEDSSVLGTFDHDIVLDSGTHTVTFLYRDDAFPTYFTSFNETTLIFDSYLATLDTTLQNTKTQCWGSAAPVFTLEDSFIPNLNVSQFSLLVNEAKARAFIELKQMANSNAERHARHLKLRTRNNKRRVPYEQPYPLSRLPNYGRK